MSVTTFDATFYLLNNPDVAAAILSGATNADGTPLTAESHFNAFGFLEQRDPNAEFDTSDYFALYPDVLAAGVNPLTHFATFGINEGRFPTNELFVQFGSPAGNIENFNDAAYLAANPDVAAAVADANNPISSGFEHFLLFGQAEGRPGAATDSGTDLTTAPAAGATLALTTGSDILTGTASDDVINGAIDDNTTANNTLTILDTIDGGAGNDTLNIIADASGAAVNLPAANIANVETIAVRNVSGQTFTLDANLPTGETTLVNDRSTNNVNFNNIAQGTDVNVVGDGNVANANTVATFSNAATSATVNLVGGLQDPGIGNNVGDINVNGSAAGLATVTVNSSGATNNVEDLVIGTNATSVNVNAANTTNFNSLSVGTNAADQTLTIAGAATNQAATATNAAAAAVNIFNVSLDADFKSVDASGLTAGGILAQVGAVTQTITGGAGNDEITTNGPLTTGSVDAGAGTGDTLIVAASADLATAALGAKFTNFEVLQVSDNVVVDLDNIAGITSVVINDQTALQTTLTDLSATQAGAVTALDLEGAFTIGVKGAATVGQLDTVSLTVSDGDTTTSEDITGTAATPTLTGVETFNIIAVDDAEIGDLTGAPALTAINISGAGDTVLTTGAIAANANTAINASAATGTVTIDASAATMNGLAITGGAGKDTLTGSGLNDVINGGAEADVIRGGLGVDTLTGGAGADDFVFISTDFIATTAATLATSADVITDFNTGADEIDFGNPLTIEENNAAAIVGTATISSEGIATFSGADDTLAEQITAVEAGLAAGGGSAPNAFAVFENSGNTFVFVSEGTNGVGANDGLIQLTGVTGITNTTLTGGDLFLA